MTELRGSVGMDMPALPRRARDVFGAELQGNKILDDLVRRNDAHVQRIALLGPAWSPPLIPPQGEHGAGWTASAPARTRPRSSGISGAS